MAAHGGPRKVGLKPTPGGDCYLLSRDGAAKLLETTADQGIQCGVDWAMIRNGVGAITSDIAQAFPELSLLKHLIPVSTPMKIYALSRPVADQRADKSVINHSVEVPISSLRGRDSSLAHVEAISTLKFGATTLSFACRSGPDPVMGAHRSGQIWDEPGLQALLERFPVGGTFVDIGAHSGNHAVVVARLGGASRIIAIEPNDEILRLLTTNMAINGVLDRLQLHPPGAALAGKPGAGWLLRNRKRPSESMVKADVPDDTDEKSVSRIDLITGDEMLLGQGQDRIDAIKIDTSGSEVDVFKGLVRTLEQHKPMVLIDHSAQAGTRIERLADEAGYSVRVTVPAGRKNRVSALLIPRRDGGR